MSLEQPIMIAISKAVSDAIAPLAINRIVNNAIKVDCLLERLM